MSHASQEQEQEEEQEEEHAAKPPKGPEPRVISVSEPLGVLRLELQGDWTVACFAAMFTGLRDAYLSIGDFLLWQVDANATTFPPPETGLPTDELLIQGIRLESPGWVEIIGKLNPFRAIRDILIVIRDWPSKRRRGEIENDILAVEVIRKKVELMQAMGMSPLQIRRLVIRAAIEPLRPVIAITERKLITDARTNPVRLFDSAESVPAPAAAPKVIR
jgi:hypothetical protein